MIFRLLGWTEWRQQVLKPKTYFEQVPLEQVLDLTQTQPSKEGTSGMKIEEGSTDETSSTGWKTVYHAALLEIDPEKLRERIALAEKTISDRQAALTGSANHQGERQAIDDAISALRVLKRDLP